MKEVIFYAIVGIIGGMLTHAYCTKQLIMQNRNDIILIKRKLGLDGATLDFKHSDIVYFKENSI